MLIEYVKVYERRPPDFAFKEVQDEFFRYSASIWITPFGEELLERPIKGTVFPKGLLEIQFKPYRDLEHGYAWITGRSAQKIFYDENGKIELVREYYQHYWTSNPIWEQSDAQREANAIKGSLTEPVYSLDENA
jgi:hypothetical protein